MENVDTEMNSDKQNYIEELIKDSFYKYQTTENRVNYIDEKLSKSKYKNCCWSVIIVNDNSDYFTNLKYTDDNYYRCLYEGYKIYITAYNKEA